MAKLKVALNRAGVRELLRSDEMLAICTEHAGKIQARLGDGYAVSPHRGKNRVNASIFAETPQARRENAENNTILKALK